MVDVPVQTKRDIQRILDSAGLRPDRRFGQNFLIDGNLMRKLVDCAEITSADAVLEVGGGTGGLSDLLAEVAGHLIIVEIDHDLAPMLATRFQNRANVTVLPTDVLTSKHVIAPVVLETMNAQPPAVGGRFLLVANLPYNVATPLIMNLLTSSPTVQRFCFSIQKEVADRLVASAGTKAFGPLAIAVQTTCRVERIARLPATAFWPAPKIESTMLRLDRQAHPFEGGERLERFLSLIHAAFAHRRKTLRYNLARHLDNVDLERALSVVDGTARSELIDLQQWIELGTRLDDSS